jgi:hypothetical protein
MICRWAFNIAWLISLLFGVTSLVLVVSGRSIEIYDSRSKGAFSSYLRWDGGIYYDRCQRPAPNLIMVAPWTDPLRGQKWIDGLRREYRVLGFHWHRSYGYSTSVSDRMYAVRPNIQADSLRIPPWLWILSSCVLPLIWTRVPRLTHGPAHCRKCGYNLAGNASGVCPECGTPIAVAV